MEHKEKKKWWKKAVVYQIYPKSFMDSNHDGYGDIQGIIDKLEYLVYLGVDVIWISPMYESPEVDNGYDISNYQKIMPRYGTMRQFEELVEKCHAVGMKVVIDLVVNHTSDQHPWFVESRSSQDNPYRDYYIWRDGKADGSPPTNWGAVFGGSTWEYDKAMGQYYLHLFTKEQPDLNWDNKKVRNEIYDMMEWWCAKGIDGFRMDVISLISKARTFADGEITAKGHGDFTPYCVHGPNVHAYLQEMNRTVLTGHGLLSVGETAGVTVEEAIQYANEEGTELSMVFQFEHMDLDGGETFKWNHRKIDLIELKDVLSKWQYGLYDKAWNSLYWCNHDQPRIVSRLGSESEEYRELSAKMLATCLHFMQGTPYIYQGEELGMTNTPFQTIGDLRDIESIHAYYEYTAKGAIKESDMMEYVRYKSRDNARTPMPWDDSVNGGFTKGTPWIMMNPAYRKINVREQLERSDSVFHYYRRLIQLRHEYEIITDGKYQLLERENDKVYAYSRCTGSEGLLVFCNFTDKESPYDASACGQEYKLLIGNYDPIGEAGRLRPYEARCYYRH